MIRTKVAAEIFPDNDLNNLWVVDKIDYYCMETQQLLNDGTQFSNTRLYHILGNIYDNCTKLIMWYSNDYEDLDILSSKFEFFDFVGKTIKEGAGEVYVYVNKNMHSRKKDRVGRP